MKIDINNFAKIKNAHIEFDGITVIAGKNNTGKSTVGKILFSFFNSLYDMDEKIKISKKEKFSTVLSNKYVDFLSNSKISDVGFLKAAVNLSNTKEVIYDEIYKSKNQETTSKHLYDYFKNHDNENINIKTQKVYNSKHFNDFLKNVSNEIISLNTSENGLIKKELTNRYFNEIFHNQINCLKNESNETDINVTIKNNTFNLSFINNECKKLQLPHNIMHEAYYIDNPFILDELSKQSECQDIIKKHMIKKLNYKREDILDNILDAVIAKEKLEKIYEKLNTVVEGNIVNSSNGMQLDSKLFNQPVKLNNLSTGLKSFVIIKILLEKGMLKEKDVLILDEPEIHLHPEWQLTYAEVIVLLQKSFDLNILVTTHSSNFLEAIDYFSKRHKISDKCNYYLSDNESGLSTFKNVNDNLEKIYSQMVKPSVLLDRLNYEMETENDE